MFADRLVREVEKRLLAMAEVSAPLREEMLDALREEIARERRRVDPTTTVESERTRRVEEETLREILEAINRQASVKETIDEVLRQLSRIVIFDSCSVALRDPNGRFRIIAGRGFPDLTPVVGVEFRDELSDAVAAGPQTITIPDVQVDDRFEKVAGTAEIRSWAGVPLVVEGEVIGILSLDRQTVDAFEVEDLHRAKAVAFSAAAAIRKGQLSEQLRRYATLMETTVQIDQAVFAGEPATRVARRILDAAVRMGDHAGGVLVLEGPGGPMVVAASEALVSLEGKSAPAELNASTTQRLSAERVEALTRELGASRLNHEVYLVPLATRDRHLGALVLLDRNGESADDRLMEAFASRAASAYLHAVRTAG